MSKSHLFAGVSLLVGVVGGGCGDDDGGGIAHSNESASTLCQRTCERAVAKNCNPTSQDSCESQCNQTAASAPAACASEVNAFLTCTSRASYSCDKPTGRADAVGCLDTFEMMNSCAAENPASVVRDAGTATADAGSVVVDAGSKPVDVGGGPVDAGVTSGSDAGSVRPDAGVPVSSADAGSVQPRPDAGAASDAGSGAVDVCAAEPGDDACDSCGKTKCCAVVSACVADLECAKLGACVSDCATLDCQQACADAASDAALEKFNASISCYGDACEAECGGESDGSDEPSADEPAGCLPGGVPEGYCTDPSRPVGHECPAAPFADCVLLPDVSDVYCCAR